jgi:hypothetical protein
VPRAMLSAAAIAHVCEAMREDLRPLNVFSPYANTRARCSRATLALSAEPGKCEFSRLLTINPILKVDSVEIERITVILL